MLLPQNAQDIDDRLRDAHHRDGEVDLGFIEAACRLSIGRTGRKTARIERLIAAEAGPTRPLR